METTLPRTFKGERVRARVRVLRTKYSSVLCKVRVRAQRGNQCDCGQSSSQKARAANKHTSACTRTCNPSLSAFCCRNKAAVAGASGSFLRATKLDNEPDQPGAHRQAHETQFTKLSNNGRASYERGAWLAFARLCRHVRAPSQAHGQAWDA